MKDKDSRHKKIMIFALGLIGSIALSIMEPYQISAASPTHIVINELYYNYENPQVPSQWVEIYNPTENLMDISGWILAFALVEGVNVFPSDVVLNPGEYLIVTHDLTAFEASFTVPVGVRVLDDNEMGDNFAAIEIDTLELVSDASVVVDDLYYGGAPGAAPFVKPPNSVARYKGGYDTGDCSNDFYVETAPTSGSENSREYTPVGGVWVPVDKLALLAPDIVLSSTILVATATTAIYVKRRKKKQ